VFDTAALARAFPMVYQLKRVSAEIGTDLPTMQKCVLEKGELS